MVCSLPVDIQKSMVSVNKMECAGADLLSIRKCLLHQKTLLKVFFKKW